jgi:Bacterial dnaA protein helix-turn-helix
MSEYCLPCQQRKHGKLIEGVRCIGGTWMCQQCLDGHPSRNDQEVNVYEAIERLGAEMRGIKVLLDLALGLIPKPIPKPIGLEPSEAMIIEAVALSYGMNPASLVQRTNACGLSKPRHLAMYLIREILHYSYPHCGLVFGRHHTTAIAGCEAIATRRAVEPDLDQRIRRLMATLNRPEGATA